MKENAKCFTRAAKKKIIISIIITLICFLAYIVVDYCDLPSKMGINTQNINHDVLSILVDLLSIVFSIGTAFAVFCITYQYVDRYTIDSQKNQRGVAVLLLDKTYKDCKLYIDSLDSIALEKLVKRTDFDKYYNQNSPAHDYAMIPFDQENTIIGFASNGVVTKNEIKDYYTIKEGMLSHVTTSVIFFDHPEAVRPSKHNLLMMIDNAIKSINS